MSSKKAVNMKLYFDGVIKNKIKIGHFNLNKKIIIELVLILLLILTMNFKMEMIKSG